MGRLEYLDGAIKPAPQSVSTTTGLRRHLNSANRSDMSQRQWGSRWLLESSVPGQLYCHAWWDSRETRRDRALQL